MSLSGRDLIVISTAAALGGGLVALAYTVGKLRKQSPYLLQEPSLADKQADSTVLSWHKLLPRSSSSQSVSSNLTVFLVDLIYVISTVSIFLHFHIHPS